MRVAIFDRVEPAVLTQLPQRIVETCSRRTAIVMLIVTIPIVVAAAAASFLLVYEAAFAPAVRAIVAEHPAITLEVMVGIAFWVYLLTLPLKRLSDRLSIRRTIEIDEGTVRVIEMGRFRTKTWTVPLASFAGVAHHIRASLSGTRHELILVHPTRDKSVLLSLADTLSQTEVDRVANLLGHKEIPASSLYRFEGMWPRLALPAWRGPAHA